MQSCDAFGRVHLQKEMEKTEMESELLFFQSSQTFFQIPEIT